MYFCIYSKLRKQLQMRQIPSARRRRKVIGGQENRWMQDCTLGYTKADLFAVLKGVVL